MSLLGGLVAQALHLALMLGLAPGLAGLIRWMKARLLNRAGPPPRLAYRDLVRLMRKQTVRPESSSFVFAAAPVVAAAASVLAAALVPSFSRGMTSEPLADLLVIAGLLALARGALILGAMDAGSAVGGIGASRVAAYAAFAEPAMLLVAVTLAVLLGTTNLDQLSALLQPGGGASHAPLGLASVALVASALAQLGVGPIASASSAAEPAMLFEALTHEHGGRDLALLEFGAAVRLITWFSLIAALFLPAFIAPASAFPLGWLIGLAAWAGKLALLAGALALAEASMARIGVARSPGILGAAILLGLLAATLVALGEGLT